jgi:hypothetical protein
MKPRGSPIPASILVLASVLILGTHGLRAEETPAAETPEASPTTDTTITCVSKAGERQHCPADTSAGVALMRSTGTAPCLLGKSWGYDDQGIWVSDACAGEFVVGKQSAATTDKAQTKQKSPEYVPNQGFRLYEGENGQI